MRGAEFEAALQRINTFERALAEDGALLLKVWLHLAKHDQKQRLTRLAQAPEARWRVGPRTGSASSAMSSSATVCTQALRTTSPGYAPWTIVEGYDAPYRYATHRAVYPGPRWRNTCGASPTERDDRGAPASGRAATVLSNGSWRPLTSRSSSTKRRTPRAWPRSGVPHLLSRHATAKRISSILVFEGWDAAGKGGAIRRVTRALDARFYRVIPIAAPTDEEQAHHYLWRFWRHLPRAGRVTIYDRSWYGRVLVERVERLAREDEWMRAYHEINEFEEQLVAHGIVRPEVLAPYRPGGTAPAFPGARSDDYKQYKITADDYRNRAQWELPRAVHDMVERTSTAYAPWHLIAANDKYHARITIVRTFCKALAKRLKG